MSNNTATIKTREKLVSTRTIIMTALLAAISYVLASTGGLVLSYFHCLKHLYRWIS